MEAAFDSAALPANPSYPVRGPRALEWRGATKSVSARSMVRPVLDKINTRRQRFTRPTRRRRTLDSEDGERWLQVLKNSKNLRYKKLYRPVEFEVFLIAAGMFACIYLLVVNNPRDAAP